MVGDARPSVTDEPRATIYFPLYGGNRSDASLVVRTYGDPLAWGLPAQKLIAQLDPTLAVAEVLPFRDVLLSGAADTSFEATVLAAFAGISLLLAVAGLFGALSYVVAMRTNEFGIRLALGAPRGQILSLALRDGLKPALAGVVFGLLASAALTRLIAALLHGTKALAPAVYLGAACALPASKASLLDPAEALRMERISRACYEL